VVIIFPCILQPGHENETNGKFQPIFENHASDRKAFLWTRDFEPWKM